VFCSRCPAVFGTILLKSADMGLSRCDIVDILVFLAVDIDLLRPAPDAPRSTLAGRGGNGLSSSSCLIIRSKSSSETRWDSRWRFSKGRVSDSGRGRRIDLSGGGIGDVAGSCLGEGLEAVESSESESASERRPQSAP